MIRRVGINEVGVVFLCGVFVKEEGVREEEEGLCEEVMGGGE